MSESLNNAAPVADAKPDVAAKAADATTLNETELTKLKDLLKTLGHDVEAVWDSAILLVKKAK